MFPWTVILSHKYPLENLEPIATVERYQSLFWGRKRTERSGLWCTEIKLWSKCPCSLMSNKNETIQFETGTRCISKIQAGFRGCRWMEIICWPDKINPWFCQSQLSESNKVNKNGIFLMLIECCYPHSLGKEKKNQNRKKKGIKRI